MRTFSTCMFSAVTGMPAVAPRERDSYGLNSSGPNGRFRFFVSLFAFANIARTADVWFHRCRSRPSAIQFSSRMVNGPGWTPTAPASL